MAVVMDPIKGRKIIAANDSKIQATCLVLLIRSSLIVYSFYL